MIFFYGSFTNLLAIIANLLCIIPILVCTAETSAHAQKMRQKWKGKIWQVLRGIIHVILLKTLQYLLSQILQMTRPVILVVLVCRHANVLRNIVSFTFSSPYSAFSYNVYHILSIILLICTTMCSYASTSTAPYNQSVNVKQFCV